MKDSLNYWAILTSAAVSFLIGFLWFTKLFVHQYVEGLDKTKEQMDQGPNALTAFILQFIGNIILAFVLAWLINRLGYQTIGESVKLAFLLWLGFVLAIFLPVYAFQAFSYTFTAIVTGGILVYFVVSAIILTLWR